MRERGVFSGALFLRIFVVAPALLSIASFWPSSVSSNLSAHTSFRLSFLCHRHHHQSSTLSEGGGGSSSSFSFHDYIHRPTD